MDSPSKGPPERPRILLVLNHRGEENSHLGAWFQARGWEVRSSSDLKQSLELLEEDGPQAAVVFPLTLEPEDLEWESLGKHLSPSKPLPWLVVPWEGVPAPRVAGFLRGQHAVSDWMKSPPDLAELEARLQNLLGFQGVLEQARGRAADLVGQLITDHKTGLFNDRHFRARLREEFVRTGRHGGPLSLILLDLDDFKSVNDRYTYEFGDQVLRTVGEILRRSMRSIDIAARIGGDEFAALLPNTSLAEAVAVSNRIREAAHSYPVESDGYRIEVHVSLGVASYDGRGIDKPRDLFLQANEALKAAKRSGKDRISVFDPRA
ncbi:MAG: GGDEF domain-containing protein [Planctomycetota bacterium]